MNRFVMLGCLAWLVVASGLLADEEKKDDGGAQGMMQPPPVPPEMKDLANWVGEWKVVFEHPDGTKEEGTYEVEEGLNGMAYIGDFEMGEFEGHAVYSYDPKGKKWHLFWFDSMAPGHGADWTGDFKDGALTVEAMEDMGNGPVPLRITEKWDGKDTVSWKMEMKQGDAWGPTMSGTYTRTK